MKQKILEMKQLQNLNFKQLLLYILSNLGQYVKAVKRRQG